MSEKRFRLAEDSNGLYSIFDTEDKEDNPLIYGAEFGTEKIVDLLNELHEENMGLRAKHTQMVIIMKDVVKDLKRIDTYRYAEHLEKIANLRFLSEKELEDE